MSKRLYQRILILAEYEPNTVLQDAYIGCLHSIRNEQAERKSAKEKKRNREWAGSLFWMELRQIIQMNLKKING